MERIEVTRPVVGLLAMQVCAVPDVTDEEILEVANRENPCGTTNGWSHVVRDEPGEGNPIACEEYPDRTHFRITC